MHTESPNEQEKRGVSFPQYAKLSRTRTKWVAKQFGLGKLPEHVGKPDRVPMTLRTWARENHIHYYRAREWWRAGKLDKWGITCRRLPWWEDKLEWMRELKRYEGAMVGINREIVRLEELITQIRQARVADMLWRYKRLYTNHVSMKVKLRIARQQVEAVQRARLEGRETWSGAEALRRAAVEERVSKRKQLRGMHGMRNAWREKVQREQVAKWLGVEPADVVMVERQGAKKVRETPEQRRERRMTEKLALWDAVIAEEKGEQNESGRENTEVAGGGKGGESHAAGGGGVEGDSGGAGGGAVRG